MLHDNLDFEAARIQGDDEAGMAVAAYAFLSIALGLAAGIGYALWSVLA